MYETTTGTGTTTTAFTNYCGHRLPCGYCRIMNAPCPMPYSNPTIVPTWNPYEVTCMTKEDET